MITCPKCGFKNNQTPATDCPKCGLIYAKYQQAQVHISAEQALNESLSQAIPSEYEEKSESIFIDLEPQKDDYSYSGISYLTTFFICFSMILGAAWIIEIMFVWSFLDSYQILKVPEKLLAILSFGIFSSLPIAIYLAIGGALRLGKDIADNTRATRNYLAFLAKAKKQ